MAKSRFVSDLGGAALLIRRYLYQPYTRGTFTKGHLGRTVALLKAAAATATVVHLLKNASLNAEANPALCPLGRGAPVECDLHGQRTHRLPEQGRRARGRHHRVARQGQSRRRPPSPAEPAIPARAPAGGGQAAVDQSRPGPRGSTAAVESAAVLSTSDCRVHLQVPQLLDTGSVL